MHTQCGIHRSPRITLCRLRARLVLPLPGGPKRKRLRPDDAAIAAISTASPESTSQSSAWRTLSRFTGGCRVACHCSIAVYALSETGAGPTYPETSSSRLHHSRPRSVMV